MNRLSPSRRFSLVSLPLSHWLTMLLFATTGIAAQPPSLDAGMAPRIVIIIDDLGHARVAGRRAVDLPASVACAFLPHTPHARSLAKRAFRRGKDVLLHQPMQSAAASRNAERGLIGLDTTRDQLSRTFVLNLQSIPHVTGVNNHEGSLLTRHPGHMRWLMEEMRAFPWLFFIDSYTTEHSVALQIATEAAVPALRRDVFLDGVVDADAIHAQLSRLKRKARANGWAVAIAHPHKLTLDILERQLPRLQDEGYEILNPSSLLATGENPVTVSAAPAP